jgi:formylmethanofuran dehydrogenase subunit E
LGRILIFVIIGFLLWLIFRGLFKSGQQPKDGPHQTKSDDMVPCSVCGEHIPKEEALEQDGRYRCRDGDACIHRKA